MKKWLIMLCCLYFVQGNAQKKADYENVIGKFMRFYNNNQADSICDLFADSWGDARKTLWTPEKLKNIKDAFGMMKSYTYMEGKPGDLLLYKVVCEKSTHAMGLSLNKNNKLLTFRFKTTSDAIEKLLQQNDSNSSPQKIAVEKYKTDSIKVKSDTRNINADNSKIQHDKVRIQHDSAALKRDSGKIKNDRIKMHTDSLRMNGNAK